jgi:hypothetical protein
LRDALQKRRTYELLGADGSVIGSFVGDNSKPVRVPQPASTSSLDRTNYKALSQVSPPKQKLLHAPGPACAAAGLAARPRPPHRFAGCCSAARARHARPGPGRALPGLTPPVRLVPPDPAQKGKFADVGYVVRPNSAYAPTRLPIAHALHAAAGAS